MISAIQQLVRTADYAIASLYLSCFRERDGLISFLFHSLFKDEQEIRGNLVDPLQRTTVEKFRRLIRYYQQHGYRFVSPADVLSGLGSGEKYALITFDDGYYNNIRALPVLEEFNVPAIFFVSTGHVRRNKCFWWDVLYRERSAQGASHRRIYREGVAMKSLRTDQIEAVLQTRFGKDAFIPRSELDRPFTPGELRDFACHPLVHLGNHSANHAILTNYTIQQMRSQMNDAQADIFAMTGIRTSAIAYPNGAHSDDVLSACGDAGLKVGFTIRPEKHSLPVDPDSLDMLRLGRFSPHGWGPIEPQCRTYRSDLPLYGLFRDGYLKLFRGMSSQ